MKINSVALHNFSSYAGHTVIDLRVSDDHNVILIGGNNGAGKTSLFTAIKLALYGPLCFHYQDKNQHYTMRIRELINRDAFLLEDVQSYVELNITLPRENMQVEYVIHRGWTLNEKRLVENYSISCEGKLLNDKDLDFFQNYLYTIVPPNLFDFFLFDGEEIGEFFSNGQYNQYIKNAVLTLSGYDTFSMIQKFCLSFVDSEVNDAETEKIASLLNECEQKLASSENALDEAKLLKAEQEDRLRQAEEEQAALEAQFKKSGGLSKEEQLRLEARANDLDHIKSDRSRQIRGFVEDLMPIVILKSVIANASNQIRTERAVKQYTSLTSILSPDFLSQIIRDLPDSGIEDPSMVSHAIAGKISERIKPDVDVDHFESIHDLSGDQENLFAAVSARLQAFDPQKIISACDERANAAREYDEVMSNLRKSLPQDEAAAFQLRIESLIKERELLEEKLRASAENIARLSDEISLQQSEQQRLRKSMQVLSRNKTAYMYTERIAEVMKKMTTAVTRAKFKEVETLTLQMFSQIIRKDNYIQLVELDQDFNISLYKKQRYTIDELEVLAQNIGVDGMLKRIGATSQSILIESLHLANENELVSMFSKKRIAGQLSLNSSIELDLYSRVELNQLSKGEKQVFILALYWAIIKTSHQSVPFIIDTPFARVDTEHREQISRVFFPEISHQVVVLSTDEEVVGAYHRALMPRIAHEYKLEYDVSCGKTSVEKGYFQEV